MQATSKLNPVAEHTQPPWTYDHRKYLSEAGLEKTASSDESQGEEGDEIDQDIDHEDSSFIGISIGAEQTRLASPSTPAAEKAAAIGEDPFADAFEQIRREKEARILASTGEVVGNVTDTQTTQSRGRSSVSTGPGPKQSQQPEGIISSALRSVIGGRPRASSGPSSPSQDRNPKKLLPISLPSLPKFSGSHRASIPSIDSALSWLRLGISNDHHNTPTLNTTSHHVKIHTHGAQDPPRHSASVPFAGKFNFENDPRPVSSHGPNSGNTESPPLLRRSTSDGSLFLNHSLSRASSLGDDTRWQNVHEQVNSRMKAIRDSLADSNFKMPRFIHFNPKFGDGEIGSHITTQTRDFGHARSTSEGFSRVPPSLQAKDPSTLPPGATSKTNAATHPQLSRALRRLTGDVVILGGYRGSVLRSAEPPHRQLWVPIKVGLGVRKVNLELGLEPEDEADVENTIIPSGMLKHIGPVEISRRLFKHLRSSKNARNGTLRIWDYGYDWRLSPHILSRQFQEFLTKLPSNQGDGPRQGAMVVAHSLGGLITRHAVNTQPDLFSGVIYAGVPQTCVNILGPFRNGDAVLLTSKVLTAQVNFSIRTSFALLPLDGRCFVDQDTNEEYRVDFFDPNTWEEHRLSPCIARCLAPLSSNPEPLGVVSQLVDSMTSVLENVSFIKGSASKHTSTSSSPANGSFTSTEPTGSANATPAPGERLAAVGPHMAQTNPQVLGQNEEKTVATAVTIPKEAAVKYLTRTLRDTKKFKEELAYIPALEDKYPPAAVMYGKSTPTVYGAGVKGREGIKHADAYDNLLFASGDGVVLARAAQIPVGYHVAKGGVVSSDRGHISLLGDLEAVGRCFNSILTEQKRRARLASESCGDAKAVECG